MPTYDYKCTECNHIFEEFQKMTDEPLEVCPSCKGKLKRLIGAGITPIFKGSGFYQTDYKKSTSEVKSNKPAPKTEKKESSPKKEVKKDKS